MRLFELAELDEMRSAAKKQQCNDPNGLRMTEQFISIIESCKADCEDYLKACRESQEILRNKVKHYHNNQTIDWEKL